MPEQRVMQDDEKWTRFGVGLAHVIGGIAASAFGAGAVVQPLGQLEQQALDAAFADRVAPGPVINQQAREANPKNTGIVHTPPIIAPPPPGINIRMSYKAPEGTVLSSEGKTFKASDLR